jgi:hypothetical protein
MSNRLQSNFIQELLSSVSKADRDVLHKSKEYGDVFRIPRPVEFFIYAGTEQQARKVAEFLSDSYSVEIHVGSSAGKYLVKVTIMMPIEEPVICSVSGFMACLCASFGVEYDGWGSPVVKSK